MLKSVELHGDSIGSKKNMVNCDSAIPPSGPCEESCNGLGGILCPSPSCVTAK